MTSITLLVTLCSIGISVRWYQRWFEKKCVGDGTNGMEQPKEAFHQQNTIAKCGIYKMDPERALIKYRKQNYPLKMAIQILHLNPKQITKIEL